MSKAGSFIIGTLAGVLTGSALALMLTPAKGEEIRSRISNSFVSIRDEVNQAKETKTASLRQELAKLQNKTIEE